MIDIPEYEKETGESEKHALKIRRAMETVLKANIGKALSFQEILSPLLTVYKETDLQILRMAWKMLAKEQEDEKPFIGFEDITFGERRPLVFQKEIEETRGPVLYIGLYYPPG